MSGRVTDPCGDDWIVQVRCRWEDRTWTRTIGVNAATTRESAIAHAQHHINTPRRIHDGMACEIEVVDVCRMWEWKARQLAKAAPEAMRQEVGAWQ